MKSVVLEMAGGVIVWERVECPCIGGHGVIRWQKAMVGRFFYGCC